MRCLCGTPELPLTLRADRTNIVKWWIDGYHGVHSNFKGHTGATQSLGQLSTIIISTKQYLNTRSSTATDLVAADEIIPHAMWTSYFYINKDRK